MLSSLRYARGALVRGPYRLQACARLALSAMRENPVSAGSKTKSMSTTSTTASQSASSVITTESTKQPLHRVCIVGSGPSGFYCAKYLLESKSADVAVDIIEKLPVPFGLVRYGVAPDHLEVKNVTDTFAEVAKNPKFRYFGNVTVGPAGKGDVSVESLLERYSAVVLAYGAESNRQLSGLFGAKNLKGVYSAREFVNWYNGHPDFVKYNDVFQLDKIRNVVIVGHGNVALDCARILTKNPVELVRSDIAERALAALRKSAVNRVTLVGRRGPVQSAFTIKEFRELTKLEGTAIATDKSDFDRGMADPDSQAALSAKRPMKRLVELIGTTVKPADEYEMHTARQIVVRYLLSPLGLLSQKALGSERIHPGAVSPKDITLSGKRIGQVLNEDEEPTLRSEESSSDNIGAIVCATNDLVPKERVHIKGVDGEKPPASIDDCASVEVIPCDLLLTSVGYKSEPITDTSAIPFDTKRHVYNNTEGRIPIDESFRLANKSRPLLYATGWLAQGPTGIIISSIAGAKQTVASIIKDLNSSPAPSDSITTKATATDPAEHIRACMLSSHKDIVEWSGHERVDAEEVSRGASASPQRPRVKVVDTREMISIANGRDV